MSRGPHKTSVWALNPDLSDELVSLWNNGASAGECAMKLGHGITRSSALGRLMRLKNSGVELRHHEAPPPRPKAPRPSRARKPVVFVPTEEPRTLEPIRLATGEYITVLNAKNDHCRYSYGDATDPEFAYCGRSVKPGHSWCESHCTIVYAPKHPATQNAEEAAA